MAYKPLSELISGRKFNNFQQDLESRFAAYRLKYELIYSESCNDPSMRLNFESQWHLGKVTVRESGNCDMEVIEIASGENVFYEHHQMKSDLEFHRAYSKLVIFMRDVFGPWSSAKGEKANSF
ncbi:MAG: hypothetical protein AAF766_01270 [Cyanobacteria bacterium P01_D01_bin.14]